MPVIQRGRPLTYADAEATALSALDAYQHDVDGPGGSLMSDSFADPAPDLLLIIRLVLEALGYDPAADEAELNRTRLKVVPGSERDHG